MTIEEQIMQNITWLTAFGKEEEGMTRLLYSKAWKAVQESIRLKMESLGFDSQYDDVGNLFTTLKGSDEDATVILCGSHIDTVVHGGNLDGQYGIAGGLLALRHLRDTYGIPRKTIQIVSMAEEEGSRFPFTFWGSKNIVGKVQKEEVEHLVDCQGITFSAAMREAGFSYQSKTGKKDEIKAFLELHIEQGGVLERENLSIGIVESIVGQKRFEIDIIGEANHAGTTPMSYRRDSIHCSSKIICKIMEEAEKLGDPMVATVGKIELAPNTPNVIPGKTSFSLDIRHDSKKVLDEFDNLLRSIIDEISTAMGMGFAISCYEETCPAHMDLEMIEKIEWNCKKSNLAYRKMISGAGHDAQIYASHGIPSAMIFVPSVNGISHNKAEYTKSEDLASGVQLLIDVLRDLAY